jgi:hypothetical protein
MPHVDLDVDVHRTFFGWDGARRRGDEVRVQGCGKAELEPETLLFV